MSNIELEEVALRLRKTCLNLATNGGCFLGASLSCVEILLTLYAKKLNFPDNDPAHPDRDLFFLSKGHDVPALYGIFCELGWLQLDDLLETHLRPGSNIYWHPNRSIPGVEFHSGSLGHILSVATGCALDAHLKNEKRKIFVLLGDGELNEGSIWEALLVIHAWSLSNLHIVIDRNGFQANLPTEELIPLEPMIDKFQSFGLNVHRCDGHSLTELSEYFHLDQKGGASVLIADTKRGKGIPSIEGRADRWFCNFNHDELLQLHQELSGKGQAELKSKGLIVR